uniref:Alpha-2-macroglobulin-like n=1 Tax=Oncorhynchus mykiss TaxID=8022 RepID=A0A8K9WP64_ONCMY
MVLPGLQVWRWILFACIHWLCVCQETPRPVYMVAVPAVIQAGSEAKLCASLLQPNETLVMTVSLMADGQNKRLLHQSSDQEFHRCVQFQAPRVKSDKVLNFKVEVRGETFLSTEERRVMIKPYSPMTFIQTDKPIYKPGQTVLFRVVTLDTHFSPVNQLDVNHNRIGQWVNATSSGNILQLSHPLNSEAPVGSYTIVVWIGGEKIYHNFKVEQYVLPKFEINMNLTDKISVGKKELFVRWCCSRVLYNAVLMFCGSCTAIHFLRCEIYHICFHLTGITLSEERNVELSYVIGEFTFVDTPQIYEHGSIIEGKINAVRYNNTPISDMLVYLFEEKGWSSYLRLQNLTTDSRGIARFSVNTTSLPKENINLVVSMIPSRVVNLWLNRLNLALGWQHLLSLIQPAAPDIKPSSSLAIQKVEKPLACGQAVSITIRYAVVGETVPKGSVAVLYLALSRGVIVQHGHINVTVQQDTEGDVTLTLAVVPEMAPVVQLLVYSMLPSETVIAHSMNFPTEKCFRNKVLVEFSPSNAVPGEENTLHLSARPGSLCGLSAVDQSVGIMEPGKRLDADKVTQLTEVNNSGTTMPTVLVVLGIQPVTTTLGLKLATNLDIRVPSCLSYQGNQYYRSYGEMSLPTLILIAKSNESWVMDDHLESGSLDVPLTVPDTITTWETEVFCLAPSGFGLAPLVELTVFQPFFLELTLPYSVIRGEHFELKATVFNYLSKCIMVSVTPALSSDYTLTPLRDVQDSSCLCANGRKTFSWTMAPSVLGVLNVSVSAAAVRSQTECDNGVVNVPERGRVDTVTRSLLVKAEGTEKSHTYNWLLCPTGEALTEEVELQLPQNVVDGSARISLSVLGDILGRALNNLDGLLQMPYGCGEQNMALLSPNIYILEYLRNTEQLTPAILEKATKFLTSGYQRQLNYKNADGAYSTFGQGLGNTWLTAFVLRSFGKAQSFIYVDPATMEQSKTWLERQQGQRGCFRTLGKLLNNRIKGGVTDEVTLTAYITASMLELNMSVTDPVVDHSLSCLKNSTSDLSNTYATALLAYTFTLAGDMETRARLLQHLDTISFQEGGLLHWSQSSSETSPSLEVEISSYVLLASLSASSRSTSDLGYASRIVRWLVRQQNAYGGFSSTQDTVVALQALALYSTRVFSRGGASTVTVRSPSGDRCLFHVNQNNKLLYQERALQDTEGKYSVEVQGSACASVQVVLRYNVPSPTRSTTLSIQVTPELSIIFLRYHGKELTTNMIIVDLKMLSGFSPDPDSLGRVSLDRVDIKDDHVLMYLTELTSLPFHITLDIIQEFPVQNLKPAVVKIYDYYQPSDQAETEYVFPCN